MLLYIIILYVTLFDYFGCANWIYSPEMGYTYKEEDIEEEFDDGVSGSPSKITGVSGIEEARNYESMLS